jgi:hypothetical protein
MMSRVDLSSADYARTSGGRLSVSRGVRGWWGTTPLRRDEIGPVPPGGLRVNARIRNTRPISAATQSGSRSGYAARRA